MSESGKRKAINSISRQSKKLKYSKFRSTNRGCDDTLSKLTKIEYGSAGIWATCVRGLEAKATAQLREVLDEYAEKLYPDIATGINNVQNTNTSDESSGENEDVEATVRAELEKAREVSKNFIFKSVRIDVACVLFFKICAPIDPVLLVQQICREAGAGKATKRTKHVNRLTPMTLMGKASVEGLGEIARKVLPPYFSQEKGDSKTFAIRPTIRNHDILKRQQVIDNVASMVGPDHSVNLSKPDLVILVDIYKNVCGMSVVNGEFEQLKRFNLNELYSVSTKSAEDPRV